MHLHEKPMFSFPSFAINSFRFTQLYWRASVNIHEKNRGNNVSQLLRNWRTCIDDPTVAFGEKCQLGRDWLRIIYSTSSLPFCSIIVCGTCRSTGMGSFLCPNKLAGNLLFYSDIFSCEFHSSLSFRKDH